MTTYRVPATTVGALRLHYNENTAGCSPAALAALQAMTREEVAFYPDYGPVTLQCERYFGVEPGWVQLINGLDEGIQVVANWTRATPSPEVLIPEPTFEVYEAFSDAAGAVVVRVPSGQNFAFPLRELLAAITRATRAIFLTDPNNPTGLALPIDAAETLAAAAPDALVLIDEAYADFSGRTAIGSLLDRRRNVIVGRTFAKGHGLAALRIGALVAHPATLDRLRRLLPPFSVNAAALVALRAALDDHEYLTWYVDQVKASRNLVYAFCGRHRLTYWPSDANFVLLRLGDLAAPVVGALRERGILVRDKSPAPGCAGCLRLTAGVVTHTTTALAALEDIIASRQR